MLWKSCNYQTEMQQRDNKIDILRFIGLSMIILAHVHSPNLIHQVRSFDVPLMLFVSGLVSSNKEFGPYGKYFIHRLKRLVIPVWLFLSAYFLLYYGSRFVLLTKVDIPWSTIIESYFFLDGIGYVWVIRVFLLIMLVTPQLVFIEKKIRSTLCYFGVCFSLLVVQLGIVAFGQSLNDGLLSTLYNQYLCYILGYSVPFMLGLRFKDVSEYKPSFWCGLAIAVFVTISVYVCNNGMHIIDFQIYKYPPYSYFIIYGSLISLLLWYCVTSLSSNSYIGGVSWIGRNTIWIYLWHIPFVTFTTMLNSWALRYFMVYMASITIFYIQYKIVKRLNNSFLNRYFVG